MQFQQELTALECSKMFQEINKGVPLLQTTWKPRPENVEDQPLALALALK